MKRKLLCLPIVVLLGCGGTPDETSTEKARQLAAPPSPWTPLANAPGVFLDTCLLLTDGRVICHQYNTNRWRRLTPDADGSYANGTWDFTADMPNGNDPAIGCANCVYRPLFYASNVLPDGRVVVAGGEYNNLVFGNTNIGFIYDPVTDSWSNQLVEAFGGNRVGDASSMVLQDGTFIMAEGKPDDPPNNMPPFTSTPGNIESLDLTVDPAVFTALNPPGKAPGATNNEENWNILYDGRILAVNSFLASSFEIYDPVANSWGNAGSTVVNLADTDPGDGSAGNQRETGPCVFRADSTAICFSGTAAGQNAVYDFNTGTFSNSANMDFPLVPGQTYHYAVADGVASLLPNGNTLVMASPTRVGDVFIAGSHFYEVEYGTNNLNAVMDTPNVASFIAYQARMVVLPSGELLVVAYNQAATQDVMLYSNGGAPQDAWRPVITVPPPAQILAGNTYSIGGTLFNGFSEGATYGDDAQMSTNYPLVRITNEATGHVFYARTHDHSRMGIEQVGSTEVVTTQFDVPAGLESGRSSLVVVTNGIESAPVTVNNQPPVAICQNVTDSANKVCRARVGADEVNNGSFDPEGDPITCVLTPSGPFGLGDTTVTLTCTDTFGASGSCTATVTVEDNTAPRFKFVPHDIKTCDRRPHIGRARAKDNCHKVHVTNDAPRHFPCGTTVVTWTATDGSGNTTTATQRVKRLCGHACKRRARHDHDGRGHDGHGHDGHGHDHDGHGHDHDDHDGHGNGHGH